MEEERSKGDEWYESEREKKGELVCTLGESTNVVWAGLFNECN